MTQTSVAPAPRQGMSGLKTVLSPKGRWALVVLVVLVVGAPIASARDMWPFVVTGIADGAVYSFAALGLVLTFKTSGIFNFAIGAQAAASAYVFYSFRIEAGLPWPVAALLALILVGLLGSLLLERMAFWLSEAPPIMRVVAMIGLIVLLQSVLTAYYGTTSLQFPPYLSQERISIGGTQVLMSQLIVIALALAATIGLSMFFRRSRMGLAMHALVDDPELLASQGTSPVVVRRYAWAVGSCFVSISGMLIAPILGIDVNVMLLLFISAFGAAALGAFDNLAVTFGAAIAIGVFTNVIGNELSGFSTPWVTSLYTQVPFLALVLALLLVPRGRLVERGAGRVRKLAPVRQLPAAWRVPTVVGVLILFVALPQIVAGTDLTQFSIGLGFAVVLLSLALLLWSSGQISLCQVAFAAIGASTFGHLQQHGTPWLLALLLAALAAVPAGALVAIPSFRLSGVYLAVATFGFGLLMQNLLYTSPWMFGSNNQISIARPDLLGMNTGSEKGFYYVALVVATLCAAAVLLVRRSRLGRILAALSDSPAALEAHGVQTKVTRLAVFCFSAFLAALGGALIGGAQQGAGGDPAGPFSYFNSLALIAVLAFCSRRPILGPVVAAFLFVVAKIYPPLNNDFFSDYRGAFFGLLAIAVAVLPGIRLPQLFERGAERADRSPVAARRAERDDQVAPVARVRYSQ